MPRESVSELFDPAQWREVEGFDLQDITYHRSTDEGRAGGVVRVAFDRPEVRNAFRPGTVDELHRALDHARTSPDVGVLLRKMLVTPEAPVTPGRDCVRASSAL